MAYYPDTQMIRGRPAHLPSGLERVSASGGPGRLFGRFSKNSAHRQVSLALQGGASFGAFTWGVLDRLIEDDQLDFDIISGTSAGALNAVLLASGLAEGGRLGARHRLEHFWTSLSKLAPVSSWNFGLWGTVMAALQASAHAVSPYQFNPLGLDPLRDLLLKEIDFDRLRAVRPVGLLIATTRVKDGQLRLFREDEITVDVVLASCCLPMLHQAVEIDGEAYWDGGFSANPPLRQLAMETVAREILLVQIMPAESETVPQSSADISRRASILAFNASLQREIEALEALRAGCKQAGLFASAMCRKLNRLRLHRITATDSLVGLARESMLNTTPAFLTRLRESGAKAASAWLAEAADSLPKSPMPRARWLGAESWESRKLVAKNIAGAC